MCKSSSLNVVYELGACGVPLRAKVEEEFIGGGDVCSAFALVLFPFLFPLRFFSDYDT